MSSGADIRNLANFEGLSSFIEGTRISLSSKPGDEGRHSPLARTVRALKPESVHAMLEHVRSTQPDFVLFEGMLLLEGIIALRTEYPDLPLIIDFHNVESNLDRQIVESRFPPLLKPLARTLSCSRLSKTRKADILAARLADAVWTCSEPDRQEAHKLGVRKPVDIIPNPIPEWTKGVEISGRGRDILFVGHLGYPPNKRAVKELCRTIMPLLTTHVPDARLHICGRNPGKRIARTILSGGHKFTSNPADLRPAYSEARVAVMPLRDGGGTRIKAIEALAVGCPIVATEKAVEGLGMVPDVHYLAADTAEDFVSALMRIYSHESPAQRLINEGRHFVEHNFGEQIRITSMKNAIERLLL